jgi:filamentous hemagglutinin family protein
MSAYPTAASLRSRRARLLAGCALAAAFSTPGYSQRAFQATPASTVNAVVQQGVAPNLDVVRVTAPQAVIDWVPDAGSGTINILPQGSELRFRVDFADQLPRYTILNRIQAADPSRAVQIDGFVNSLVDTGYGISNGAIWFYAPGGIIASSTSRFDVGSLVLTTNDIQIGDFVSEGLFAGADTDAVAGTIRFRGTDGSRSTVTVQSGAQINATSNYVALVASRVIQNGTVSVDGGAAYIAAEQVDMTVPMSGGLFSIQVSVGTGADTPTETVLDHGGKTSGPSGENMFFANRRIHMMAVPKNDAVTMLVAGEVGYLPASQADLVNGDIVLTTGTGISGGGGAQTPLKASTINLAGGDFTSDLSISADKIEINPTKADLTFSDDLFAFSPNGFVRMLAEGGRKITVADDVFIGHSQVNPATGTALLELSALSGGSIKADLISLSSQGNGALDMGYGATSGAAGSISVLADGGTIDAGSLTLNAKAIGGSSNVSGNAAGTATGDIVTVAAKGSSGQILAGAIDMSVNAEGGDAGYGAISSGFGKAGSITLLATGGATIAANSAKLTANGLGGDGPSGAVGSGGVIDVDFTTASVTVAGTLTLEATGTGGNGTSSGTGADGLGGTVSLGTAGGSFDFSSLIAKVDGTGNGSFFFANTKAGGTGKAGTAALTFSGTALTGTNEINLSATGLGGDGVKAGASLGGSLSLTVENGSLLVSDSTLSLVAKGLGENGEAGGGIAVGGTIDILIDNATLDVNNFSVDASAQGGEAFGEASFAASFASGPFAAEGSSGSGTGGSVNLLSRNGGQVFGAGTFRADGTGGDGNRFAGITAGAGNGGFVQVRTEGGSIDATGGTLLLAADGIGGNQAPVSLAGGPILAKGGSVLLDVSGGGQLLLSSLFGVAGARYEDSDDGINFETLAR